MIEHPIIFSGPMVRAILDGRKSTTRRVVKFRPGFEPGGLFCRLGALDTNGSINSRVDHLGHCVYHTGWAWQTEHGWCNCQPATYAPPAMPGDLLYVREAWARRRDENHIKPSNLRRGTVWYAADSDPPEEPSGCAGGIGKWRPSIHMPKWAARIWLRVAGVRVERVRDISEPDAEAEGCEANWGLVGGPTDPQEVDGQDARVEFADLWDSINAKRGFGWETNPLVWVVEFERRATK